MTSTKPTTCKEAIRLWEEENGQEASSAKEVILSFQWPPIEKMDNALSTLVNCEKLSLSTNMIEKIAGRYPLSGLLLYSSFRSYTSYYTYLILRGALFVEGKFLPFSSIIFSSVNALININSFHPKSAIDTFFRSFLPGRNVDISYHRMAIGVFKYRELDLS